MIRVRPGGPLGRSRSLDLSLGVGFGSDIGMRCEVGGWREAPVLVEQVGQGLISHD